MFWLSSPSLAAAFLWGAPWRWQEAHRMVKAMRGVFIVGALGLTAILSIFLAEARPRIAFYIERLGIPRAEPTKWSRVSARGTYLMAGLVSAP